MTTATPPRTSHGVNVAARLDRCRALLDLAARLAVVHRFVPLAVDVHPAQGLYPAVETDRLSIYVMDDDPDDLNRVGDELGFAPSRELRDDDTTVLRKGIIGLPGGARSGVEVTIWCGIPGARGRS